MTPTPAPSATRTIRTDIQGLRAFAVIAVVAYHLWPNRVGGGFVGVDVFFVISGFLITSHLIEVPPRNLAAVSAFWGRRIRRILPAAAVVLGAVLVAGLFLQPDTAWARTGAHVAFSALFVENWHLAFESVDYLASSRAPSAVQHYWSLSVEEQLYVVWPIALLVALFIATRLRRGSTRVVVGTVAVIAVVGSLVYAQWLVSSDPLGAFFSTPARVWEFAAGGALAAAYPRVEALLGGRAALRSVSAWVGVALIGAACLVYSDATPFPGVAAALPVAGAVLLIAARSHTGWHSPARLLDFRPIQYLGDISYSVYLWHWPLIVFLVIATNDDLETSGKLEVIAATLVLAVLTKHLVEDPFRKKREVVGRRLATTIAAATMAATLVVSVSVQLNVAQAQAEAAESLRTAVAAGDPCFGAAALDPLSVGCQPHGAALLQDPLSALDDEPEVYADDCWIEKDFGDQRTCDYGTDDPDAVQVALVGNSHAGHWLPALMVIANAEHWHVTTYLISECFTVNLPIDFGWKDRTTNCLKWNKRVLAETTTGDFDLVVTSNRTHIPIENVPDSKQAATLEKAYEATLQRWNKAGVPVLVIRDNPVSREIKDDAPVCVSKNRDNLDACDGTLSRKVEDPMFDAALTMPDSTISTADFTRYICDDTTCYSVVGGVIVYFDHTHLTATFSRSLAPYLRPYLIEALNGRAGG